MGTRGPVKPILGESVVSNKLTSSQQKFGFIKRVAKVELAP